MYEMTDCLADQDYDGAMRILADLLADKDNTPIFLLAVIGQQMRRLYAARLARRAERRRFSAMKSYGTPSISRSSLVPIPARRARRAA